MARTRIVFAALWMGLLLVAGCASMQQPGQEASASVVMEEFMVPASDAGIQLGNDRTSAGRDIPCHGGLFGNAPFVCLDQPYRDIDGNAETWGLASFELLVRSCNVPKPVV